MTSRNQGFWLPNQKRGQIAIFDGIAWRRATLTGATITYAEPVTITTAGATAVRSYISFGSNMSGQTYSP